VSDLKLFRITDGAASELASSTVALEKSLQTTVEDNMETFFGVRFLASEYSTGRKHAGRIDSLGLDENSSPVIFEYKRATNENVINQGLFYLDWLLDHQAEFQLLVLKRLGAAEADAIDWRNPRLICVANGYTRYDEYAVQQIDRNIELVRYRDFEGKLLALELIRTTKVEPASAEGAPAPRKTATPAADKTVAEYLDQAPEALRDLYFELERFCEGLGDDVTKKVLKFYFAFRRLKNFACVEVHPQSRNLLVYLKVNPDDVELEPGFSRDVRTIGHFGTGDLELKITNRGDLERALPLVQRSYEAS
jgi:predicted transport protein